MNSNIKISGLLMGCSFLLTACGGSSTGSSSFETIVSEGRAILDQYGAAAATDPANMPTTGTATYNGAAAYSSDYSSAADIVQYAETVSDVTLTADFANSTVTGTADNFHTVSTPNVTLSGSLSLNGTISGNSFSTDLNGTVTETLTGLTGAQAAYNGTQVPFTYTGSTSGVFVGSAAEAFLAVGTGTGTATFLGENISETVNAAFGGVQD